MLGIKPEHAGSSGASKGISFWGPGILSTVNGKGLYKKGIREVGIGHIQQSIQTHHHMSRDMRKSLWGFWPSPTQTSLYSHRRWLEDITDLIRRGIVLFKKWKQRCWFTVLLLRSWCLYFCIGKIMIMTRLIFLFLKYVFLYGWTCLTSLFLKRAVTHQRISETRAGRVEKIAKFLTRQTHVGNMFKTRYKRVGYAWCTSGARRCTSLKVCAFRARLG